MVNKILRPTTVKSDESTRVCTLTSVGSERRRPYPDRYSTPLTVLTRCMESSRSSRRTREGSPCPVVLFRGHVFRKIPREGQCKGLYGKRFRSVTSIEFVMLTVMVTLVYPSPFLTLIKNTIWCVIRIPSRFPFDLRDVQK